MGLGAGADWAIGSAAGADLTTFQLGREYVNVNLPLTGTGTHPQAVVTPGTISDLIGNDVTPQAGYAGDGGPASGAQFVTPAAVAMDVMGNIYIADTGNNVVRLYYQQGTFPEIAGTAGRWECLYDCGHRARRAASATEARGRMVCWRRSLR
jgi:hypothetical protein